MIVYKVTNLVNGKLYVGITSVSLEARKSRHLSAMRLGGGVNIPLYNAMRKHGEENFSWEIIDRADSFEELKEKEKYWIKELRTYTLFKDSNGYNATLGGQGTVGHKHTKESIKKMSESSRGNCNIFKSGTENPSAKLNEEKVSEIRKLYATGQYNYNQLSKLFGVSTTTIGKIIRLELWRDVG